MATIKVKSVGNGVHLGNTPWGNYTALRYIVETNAAGAVINSNSQTPIAANDVLDLGHLPSGFRYVDSYLNIIAGMKATATADLGFAYKDGVDDASVPQDADYFGTGMNVATAARLRNATTNASIVLPKDANLLMTIKTVGNDKASKIEIVIFGIAEGVK